MTTRRSYRPRPHGLWLAALALLAPACASTPPQPRSATAPRLEVPIPICLAPLARGAGRAPLPAADYWPLLWPKFDELAAPLDPRDRDCAGRQPLSAWTGTTAVLHPHAAGASVTRSAEDFEIVWLPIDAEGDARGSGLLALGRRRERQLEVYAIGVHAGDPERSRFTWQRIGSRLLISALSSCDAASAPAGCESSVNLYLARRGRLSPLGTLALERSFRGVHAARGSEAPEYHFRATLQYRADGIHLQEYLTVRDRLQGELRRSELERVLVLRDDQLVESEPSLWQQALAELSTTPR